MCVCVCVCVRACVRVCVCARAGERGLVGPSSVNDLVLYQLSGVSGLHCSLVGISVMYKYACVFCKVFQ